MSFRREHPHEVVVNDDAGVLVAGANNTTRYVNEANFTQALTNTTAENSSTHLFHLSNASQGEAGNLLRSRSIDALIIIPQSFSAGKVYLIDLGLSSPTIGAKDDAPLVFEA